MPHHVFFSPAFATVVLSGVVGWAECRAIMRSIYHHPLWVVGGNVLWDIRDLVTPSLTPSDFPEVGPTFDEVAAAREGGRTAVLMAPQAGESMWPLFFRFRPQTVRPIAYFTRVEDALGFLRRGLLPEAKSCPADRPAPTLKSDDAEVLPVCYDRSEEHGGFSLLGFLVGPLPEPSGRRGRYEYRVWATDLQTGPLARSEFGAIAYAIGPDCPAPLASLLKERAFAEARRRVDAEEWGEGTGITRVYVRYRL